MKLRIAAFALTVVFPPGAVAQTCNGVSNPNANFILSDITGTCNYEVLVREYTRQVFDAAGATCADNTLTAQEDLDAKLMNATNAATGEEGADIVCKAMYDNAEVTPFTNAAGKATDPTDLHFEQMFYNGRGEWQEEVETIYESADGTATSVLREDAARVREFYRGEGSYSRVQWPNMLTNFDDSTCASHAAMCCWPKDRQANDGNGNCAKPYDENCVNKDPADNTNLCFADLAKGDLSTGFDSANGFMVFPEDNNNGEGAIHCHGFAWADDEYDTISRYKANNLFFVSMYDHMHQRGYVENIPGMPMCGCMEQMPVATRSDCTQVDLTEDWRMEFDGTTFTGHLEKVEIDFNSCKGRNNRNNDLWAYAARLYDEGRMTRHQFGAVGRVLTNDHDCYHATEFEKAKKGYIVGYDHDESMWTKVAGRDDMKDGEPFGREAFNTAFFEQSLTPATPIIMRICPDCKSTHRKIFYRRLTPVDNSDFDLLHNILYHRSSSGNADNRWGEDFTLHSTYEDAVSGADAWECPDVNGVPTFNYWATFYGECSPTGARVRDQYSVWNWFPGPRPNVAYYVNKAETVGVQDYSENDSVTRAQTFNDVDIGEPGMEGNTMENNGVYHVSGSGSGMWDRSDQFHFKSEQWQNDIDVKVHLTDFANNGGQWWAKAGIMLRSDNSADATYAFVMLTGNEGINVQYRRSKGKHAEHLVQYKTNPIQKSAWLRIVKKMETVEFYRSETGADGDWVLMGSRNIFFPNDSYRVGLAVSSARNDYIAEATFEDYEIATYEFPTAAPSLSSAPTAWQPLVDIGDPQRDGEFYPNGDNTIEYVKGSGTGIWGSSDSFTFYNEQLANGDMEVEMYINRFDNHDIFARGGLMMRASNDANAANVFVGAAGQDQGAVFQSRSAAGASTDHHRMIYVNGINQFWVKLSKVGDLVTASYKREAADAWIELGSTTLTAGATLQVGRAITAGTDYQWALNTLETKSYTVTPVSV